MPTVQVQAPDGTIYTVEHPQGASDEEIMRRVQAEHLFPDNPRQAYGATATEHETKIPPNAETTKRGALAAILSGVPIAGEAMAGKVATPQQREEFRRYYPGQEWLAGTAGGAATAGAAALAPEVVAPLLGTSRGLGMVGNAIGGAVGGSGIGAADAYMRGQNPLVGGGIGAVAGAGAPVLGHFAGEGARIAADKLRPMPSQLSGLNAAGRQMLATGVGDATPQSLTAARQGMGPATFAGELTPGLQDLTRGIAQGADLAGTNVRNAYNERFAGARGRIEDAVTANMGFRGNVPQEAEAILQQRSREGKPLFEAAMNYPVPNDPRLQQFMTHPDIQKGMNIGVEQQAREALATGQPSVAPQGFRKLAAAKTGLDAMVEANEDPMTGRLTQNGRSLAMLRDAFVQHLDSINPHYAAARQSWEGNTKAYQALSDGSQALRRSVDPNELAYRWGSKNASERDMYQLGMRNDVAMLMDASRNGDSHAKTLLLSPMTQAKIATVFGRQESQALTRAVQQEADLAERTRSVVPNWSTGASNVNRQEALALANPPSQLQGYLSRADFTKPFTLLGVNPDLRVHAAQAMENANMRGRQQLAPILTSPAANDDLVRALVAARNRQAGNERIGSAVNRGTTLLGAIPGAQQARNRVQY